MLSRQTYLIDSIKNMTEATAINPVLEIKEKVFASTFYFPDIYSITLCYLRLYEYYLSREKC